LWDGLILQVPDAEDEQAIVVPPGLGNGGKRVHPLPYLESNLPGMDYSYFLLLLHQELISVLVSCSLIANGSLNAIS